MGTAACRRYCRQSLTGFSLAADFAGVPGRSPGSCFSGRSAFPSPPGDSGLSFHPTQLQWRGRAGFAPDFPFGQTAPGTPLIMTQERPAVKSQGSGLLR